MSGQRPLVAGVLLAILVGGGLVLGRDPVLGKSEPAVQAILIQAEGGKFNGVNPTFEVRRGVPVQITVRNKESGAVPHDFVLAGLDIKTPKLLEPGDSAILRFTPSRSGEFAYSCTLHPGLMDGRLIVRP